MTRIALIIANVSALDFSRLRRGCERSARRRPGRCWVNPTVSKNRDTKQFMDKVELEYIQRLDTQEQDGMTSLANISAKSSWVAISRRE
jgi:hypothetical protein